MNDDFVILSTDELGKVLGIDYAHANGLMKYMLLNNFAAIDSVRRKSGVKGKGVTLYKIKKQFTVNIPSFDANIHNNLVKIDVGDNEA